MGVASSKLKVRNEIGRGAYGTVHEGVYEGRPVAVKKIHRILVDYARNDPEAFQRILSEFERECELLKTLVFPNVVQFVGVFKRNKERVLVMELLHETLANALERKKVSGGLTEVEARGICFDIACGLKFLHGQNPPLVHCDLNAKNILLTKDGTAKISDLGMSKFCPTDLGYLSTKAPGCLPYMPPEALGEEPQYTEKLDMFSFGVLMLQMATGEDPNPDMHGIGSVQEVVRIRRKDHIELVPDSHVLKKVILQCLEDDPSKRPTAQTIMLFCFGFCKALEGFHHLESRNVCCVHSMDAGCSSLVFRYKHGHFDYSLPHQVPQAGPELAMISYGDTEVHLWSTPGAEKYARVNEQYYRSSNGISVVVDVTDIQSLHFARYWKQKVDSCNPGSLLPAILLANKCDLVDERTVTAGALAELAEELHCFAYFEVSAKTGQNVKEAFDMLFNKILMDAWLSQNIS